MEIPKKETMTATVIRVLEQAAFLFADEIDRLGNPLYTGVSVTFQGPRNGHFELWTVNELAGVIADNLLGEENVTDEQKVKIRQVDALKETLNMIAGNIITDLFGTELVFNLQIPSVIQGSLEPETIPQHAVILSVEEFPLVLKLELENGND